MITMLTSKDTVSFFFSFCFLFFFLLKEKDTISTSNDDQTYYTVGLNQGSIVQETNMIQ
jgi:hypothetical protein